MNVAAKSKRPSVVSSSDKKKRKKNVWKEEKTLNTEKHHLSLIDGNKRTMTSEPI